MHALVYDLFLYQNTIFYHEFDLLNVIWIDRSCFAPLMLFFSFNKRSKMSDMQTDGDIGESC